jgi:hypothetical protein
MGALVSHFRVVATLTRRGADRHALTVRRRRELGWGIAAAASLLALAALPAAASVTTALDLRELVTEAEHVVLATVVSQRSSYDARRRIVTDVTLRVEDAMKGGRAAGATLVVRRLGGAIGDLGMRVEGEASFADGERVVLFGATIGGHLRPVGLSQGVLPVRTDTAGRELVFPGGGGLALVREVRGRLVPAPAALLEPRPLSDVIDEIRVVVAETARAH